MLKMGLDKESVRVQMISDRIDPDILEEPPNTLVNPSTRRVLCDNDMVFLHNTHMLFHI